MHYMQSFDLDARDPPTLSLPTLFPEVNISYTTKSPAQSRVGARTITVPYSSFFGSEAAPGAVISVSVFPSCMTVSS